MAQHTILVPIDGSAFSGKIIAYVQKFLAPQENAIVLLRVAPSPEGHIGLPARVASADTAYASYDTARDAEQATHPIYASQERAALEGEIRLDMQPDIEMLRMAGFTVTPVVRFGEAADEIVDYISTHDIDLVALATHWRQGIDRLIHGGVARHILGHVSTPVLLVHPQED